MKLSPFSALWVGGLCITVALAGSCPEGQDNLATLPPVIGVEGGGEKKPYPLYCDTITVPEGSTTVIHAGNYLYFVRKNPNNMIRVKGTLLLKGVQEEYVWLAGGRDMVKEGIEPSNARWAGILVEAGGRFEAEFSGIYGATNPIIANSPQVKIVNTFFTGGKGIVRPDGSWYLLDSQFTAVNLLDLSKHDSEKTPAAVPAQLSAEEKADLLKEKKSAFWTAPKTWMALGGGAALIGGGYLTYLLVSPEPKTKPEAMDPLPPKP